MFFFGGGGGAGMVRDLSGCDIGCVGSCKCGVSIWCRVK